MMSAMKIDRGELRERRDRAKRERERKRYIQREEERGRYRNRTRGGLRTGRGKLPIYYKGLSIYTNTSWEHGCDMV